MTLARRTPASAPGTDGRQVTICVCTRNRPESLRKTLESVRASSVSPQHVVVADDSTDERTVEMVRRDFPEAQLRLGPRRGLGANRNTVVAAASSRYILFLDDDCLLDENYLERALECVSVASDPERTIVTGCENNNGALVSAGDQTFLGFQRRRYGDHDTMYSVVINATLFPRALFDEASFDEQLIYGYDEVDLSSRAVALGYHIVPCPEAINHHFPSSINRDYYGSHANSARLYVTYKRYRYTERRPLKGLAFLVVSVIHLFASMFKAGGLNGLRLAPGVVSEAFSAIAQGPNSA